MNIIIKPGWRETFVRGFKDPAYYASEILEHDLHEQQKECIRKMPFCAEFGLTTGNRWGKGDLITVLGSWIASYKPVGKRFKNDNIAILNTSISQDQANIVFDKFNERFVNKPKFNWLIKDIKRSPFPHIKFKTGMIWWFRNAAQDGKFLEGRSYFWANFDEADLQPDLETFFSDIMYPRLWDYGGWLSWTTTPRRGKKNAYKVWSAIEQKRKAGDVTVDRYQGDARFNKFIDKSAIERMNALPLRLHNKNVLGIYDDSDGCITNEMCDYAELIADGLEDRGKPGGKYVNIWDLARIRTYNVGITLELGEIVQLKSWERTRDPQSRTRKYWQLIKKRIRDRHSKFRGKTILDATGLGDVIGSDLSDIKPVLVKLSTPVRNEIIEAGINAIEMGHLGLPLQGDGTHKPIEQILGGEYWCLRDELTDFDPEALDHIIWDFVCCLFIGVWFSRGYRPGTKNKGKKAKPPSPPRVKGVCKYGAAVG